MGPTETALPTPRGSRVPVWVPAAMAAAIGTCIVAAPLPALSHDDVRDSLVTHRDSSTGEVRDPPVWLIAGLQPCTAALAARWPWSGTWLFPVGDSLAFGKGVGDEAGYRVNRGVLNRASDGAEHDGADLANGSAGGRVRAAASGVVVAVEPRSGGGYGSFVVLAHHVDDGTLVYTVYSHLLAGSTRITEGETVSAGDWIARVGQTGRATTPHLHFEVRLPRDSTLRWEHEPVVDPVAYVSQRLPGVRRDTSWAAPYMSWAEFAALIPPGLDAAEPLDAALLGHILDRLGIRAPDFNGAAGEPRPATHKAGTGVAEWNDVARALASLNVRPQHLPPCSIEAHHTEGLYARQLGVKRPAHELPRLAGRSEPPTVGDLCLALTGFASHPSKPRHAPHKRSRRR